MTTTAKRPTAPQTTITGSAAVYTRVSTEDQTRGTSLDTQRDDCARYAESRGMAVCATFTDVQSGLKSDRVQYQEMLKAARNGDFNTIVVWRLDRFGRDRLEAGNALRDLQRVGCKVESATEPNDSPLLRNILMDLSEEESRRISVRVTAGKRARAQSGRRTSKPPFGYDNVPYDDRDDSGMTLQPNADAPVVAEAFRMYASGQHSLRHIRDYVNQATTNPRRPQTRSGIHHMLKNPAYTGLIRHGKYANSGIELKSKAERAADMFEVQSDYEAIVDRQIFERVQQRMAKNQHQRSGAPRTPYLFAGLILCSCGHRYAGHKTSRGKVSYFCNRKAEAGDCTSSAVMESRIREQVLPPIEALLGTLKKATVRKAVQAELKRQIDAVQSAAQLDQQSNTAAIERLESQLTSLEDMYLAGDFARDRYIVQRDRISSQIAQAREQSVERPPAAPIEVTQLFELAANIGVEDMDNAAWRSIIEGMVEGIVIHGRDIEVSWKAEYVGLVTG